MSRQTNAIETEEEDFVDELKPGTELMRGQYTIEAFLAAGGFGITYLARDSLKRRVVIKECFPGSFCRRQNTSVTPRSRAHQAELRSIVRLFSNEAESLAKANHPNIVGVHQVFEENNTAYMALDYVQGRDLLEILEDDHASLTPQLVEGYLRKVLDAIQHIHEQGLLHRDISPDNIIINEKGEPILIDFGAARENKNEKVTRMLSALRVVKDGYSPQEFYIAGSEQSPSCDLYSLAASFYHIITQELPPDSQLRLSSRAANDGDPYLSLGEKTKDYSTVFVSGLDKAMSILPRDRMQNAEEWLAHLDGTATAQPEKVAPENTAPAKPRAAASGEKKSTMPVLLGTTGLIAAGAAGFFMMSSGGDAPTSSAPLASETVTEVPSPAAPINAAELAPTETAEAPDPLVVEPSPEPVETVAAPAPIEAEITPPASIASNPGLTEENQSAARDVPAFQITSAPTASPAAPTRPETVNELAEIELNIVEPVQPASDQWIEVASEPAAVTLPGAFAAPGARPLLLSELAVAAALDTTPSVSIDAPAVLSEPEPLVVAEISTAVEDPVVVAETPAPTGVDFFVSMAMEQPELRSVLAGPMANTAPAAPAPLAAVEPVPVIDNTTPFVSRFVAAKPFTLSRAEPGVIEIVYGDVPRWLSPESRIVSVNGQAVSSNQEINDSFEALASGQEAGSFQVSLGVDSGLSGVVFERSLTVSTEKHTLLLNGLKLVASEDTAGWATRVAEVPAGSNFRVGDTLVSYVPTWEQLDGPSSLQAILEREIEQGRSSFSFAVNRDGEIWIEAFEVTTSMN